MLSHCLKVIQFQNYSDHIWLLGDILIASADSGEVYIFERGEVKATIPPFHPATSGITVLAALTKVFNWRCFSFNVT